jgi:hypothetical protein
LVEIISPVITECLRGIVRERERKAGGGVNDEFIEEVGVNIMGGGSESNKQKGWEGGSRSCEESVLFCLIDYMA